MFIFREKFRKLPYGYENPLSRPGSGGRGGRFQAKKFLQIRWQTKVWFISVLQTNRVMSSSPSPSPSVTAHHKLLDLGGLHFFFSMIRYTPKRFMQLDFFLTCDFLCEKTEKNIIFSRFLDFGYHQYPDEVLMFTDQRSLKLSL